MSELITPTKGIQRNQSIDLIKGICIIFMVMGHTALRGTVLGFVYLFHMAVFFIASGFLFNEKYLVDIKAFFVFVLRKVKGLYIPLVLYTELFVLLNNLFIHVNIYLLSVPENLNQSYYYLISHYYSFKEIIICSYYNIRMDIETAMGGALWFFKTLFLVLFLFGLISFILARFHNKVVFISVQGILSIAFLVIGYIETPLNLNYRRVLTVYVMVYLGYIIRQLNIVELLLNVKKKLLINAIASALSLAILIVCYYSVGSMEIATNTIINPVYFIFVSLVGWFFVQTLSNLLIFGRFNKINKAIQYISRRSVSIVALHFLSTKIVSYIGIRIYDMDIRYLAVAPTLFKDVFSSILYIIVGIAVPLAVDYGYLQIKKKIQVRFHQKKTV